MKIVASGDIGDLGPKDGTPVSYRWHPWYHVLGALPWLLPAAAFILLKENRRSQVFWILLPVLLCRLLWTAFTVITNMPLDSAVQFTVMIDCLLIGLALNSLLAERIGNRSRWVTWLLAWLVFAGVYGVMLVNIGLSSTTIQVSIVMAIILAILMLSAPLAAFLCRKNFGAVRFTLWTLLWLWLLTMTLFTAVLVIQSALSGSMFVAVMLLQVLMIGSIFTAFLAVTLLPFEILWFKNPFWRKRFEALFGIKTRRPVEVLVEVPVAEIPSE